MRGSQSGEDFFSGFDSPPQPQPQPQPQPPPPPPPPPPRSGQYPSSNNPSASAQFAPPRHTSNSNVPANAKIAPPPPFRSATGMNHKQNENNNHHHLTMSGQQPVPPPVPVPRASVSVGQRPRPVAGAGMGTSSYYSTSSVPAFTTNAMDVKPPTQQSPTARLPSAPPISSSSSSSSLPGANWYTHTASSAPALATSQSSQPQQPTPIQTANPSSYPQQSSSSYQGYPPTAQQPYGISRPSSLPSTVSTNSTTHTPITPFVPNAWNPSLALSSSSASTSLAVTAAATAPVSAGWEGAIDQTPPTTIEPSTSFGGLLHSRHHSGSHNNNIIIDDDEFRNEPPLLEELGVNWEHIYLKTKAVVLPFRRFSYTNSNKSTSAIDSNEDDYDARIHNSTQTTTARAQSSLSLSRLDPDLIVQDADLAGPLALALLLAVELLCMGKIHFGYIYGFGMFGCLSLTLVLNLLSPTHPVSIWTVTSILGYALLPVNLLAALRILCFWTTTATASALISNYAAVLVVLWSTTASTRLLEIGCRMTHQRYLIAYPIALLYSAFVLITIF